MLSGALLRLTVGSFIIGAASCWTCRALAQTGQTEDAVSVDAAQAFVTGSTRVIGLGGAFTAIAEGMGGVAKNPASVAVRAPYSFDRWDYGFGFSLSVAAWLPETDFLNRGEASDGVEQRSVLFGSVGATLQYDHFGIGVAADGQQQALERSAQAGAGLAPTELRGNFGIAHASMAYGLFGGQMLVGAGPRVTGLALSSGGRASQILSVAGAGYQVGAILKPNLERYRVGVAFKSAVAPSLDRAEADLDGAFDARALRVPWELAAGVAYQLGPRSLNEPLVTVHERTRGVRRKIEASARRRAREEAVKERAFERHPTRQGARELAALRAQHAEEARADEALLEKAEQEASFALLREYQARPRRYWLVSTDVVLLGPTDQSVSFGSLWQIDGDSSTPRSGQEPTLSPRLGVETEAIVRRLKVRAGTYWEPARLRDAEGRLHGTLGFDLKMFHWDVFGLIGDFDGWVLSVAADGARQYLNTAFSVGFWH